MLHDTDRDQLSSARSRIIDLESWSSAGVPLLRDPRDLIGELHQRHLPQPGTSVIAVLDLDHRVVASAAVTPRPHVTDGWHHRNAILGQLRRVIPHDLRLSTPRRTAVLLRCRDGASGWTEQDGAWMWALRDAAALHGLRCGAYLALTPTGWLALGEDAQAGLRTRGPGPTGRCTPSPNCRREPSGTPAPYRSSPEPPGRGTRRRQPGRSPSGTPHSKRPPSPHSKARHEQARREQAPRTSPPRTTPPRRRPRRIERQVRPVPAAPRRPTRRAARYRRRRSAASPRG